MAVKVLAIDLGASSGRAIVGGFDGGKIMLEEIHRFSNDPVIVGDTMHWDILRLFHEIKQSLIKSKKYGDIESVAIDTWGVDFGLLDKDGRLLENPVHYRDSRTDGMLDKAFELIDRRRLYDLTGNQLMQINTAFQLLSLVKSRPELIGRADRAVLMPDLLGYFLSGKAVAEHSIASTTQLFDQCKRQWADEVFEALGIKRSLMPETVESGTVIGTLSRQICEELDIKPMKVIAACGHDTQCALVAAPAKEKDFIFLSSGTWSLLGTELSQPMINDVSYTNNVTNELGFGGKTAFLKNIIGLWLIQESRRQWIREGNEYSYAQLEAMAREAKPFKCFIDPDAPQFSPSGNIPRRIREYCAQTGQQVPETAGEIMRCIYESLALKYRSAKEELEACTGKRYEAMYMVGGGTKDRFISQLAANACGCKVSSGPVEATAFGNIAIQLMALGEIADLTQAREIISSSEKIYSFEPESSDEWAKAYERFLKVTEG